MKRPIPGFLIVFLFGAASCVTGEPDHRDPTGAWTTDPPVVNVPIVEGSGPSGGGGTVVPEDALDAGVADGQSGGADSTTGVPVFPGDRVSPFPDLGDVSFGEELPAPEADDFFF